MQNSKETLKRVTTFSVQEMAYLALLVAACVVGRTMFQFLPNIQPMTAIFLIITFQLGVSRGLLVCLLSVICTNLYMGMGVWTIGQIISFSGVILVAGALWQLPVFRKYFFLQVAYSFVAGFLYGFFIALVDKQIYGLPKFLPYYLQGLSFDVMHALGNVGFYVMLAPILVKLLSRIKK